MGMILLVDGSHSEVPDWLPITVLMLSKIQFLTLYSWPLNNIGWTEQVHLQIFFFSSIISVLCNLWLVGRMGEKLHIQRNHVDGGLTVSYIQNFTITEGHDSPLPGCSEVNSVQFKVVKRNLKVLALFTSFSAFNSQVPTNESFPSHTTATWIYPLICNDMENSALYIQLSWGGRGAVTEEWWG